MKSLLLVFENGVDKALLSQLKQQYTAEVVRFDLAWELFLGDKGTIQQGDLELPAGNPRTQWLPLSLWVRETLGGITNIIGHDATVAFGVISRCSAATLEYVSRMMSMYSTSFGVIHIKKDNDAGDVLDSITRFVKNEPGVPIGNEWYPPIINLFDKQSAFLQQTSGVKNGDHYTWLTGFLGSNRLFSQIYQLGPNSSGNRLHGHSDVDEMFVVLEGTGSVKTAQGIFPIKTGDVIAKPGGSSLSAQFIAGEQGITILDIECWSAPDQTDIVVYPEHQEAALRGRGLNHGVALASFFSGDEISRNYNDSYRRNSAGEKI